MTHMSGAFTLTQWKPYMPTSPSPAVQFALMPHKEKTILNTECTKSPRPMVVPITAASSSVSNDNNGVEDIDISSGSQVLNGKAAKGSGTTARGRRLLKVREEKRKREYDKIHNYPPWAK